MKPTILIAIVFALVPASFVSGQFALDSLPETGAWARYKSTATVSGSPGEKHEWLLTIRCLPDSTKREFDCVWIEMEFDKGNDGTVTYKMLFAKSDFRPENPGKKLIEGWKYQTAAKGTGKFADVNWDDEKPQRMADVEIELVSNYTWFVVPPENAKQLKDEIVEANGQKFTCKGFSFDSRFSVNDKSESIWRFVTRVSPDTPFGLVSWENEWTVLSDGKESSTEMIKTILVESGEDAVSSLPDIN